MKRVDKSNPENLKMELELQENGYEFIACTDECGRGPFSGPVVAASVIMPRDVRIDRLTDSKKLSKKEHEYFSEIVKEKALYYSIGIATVEEIDAINIKQASRLAMLRSIESLKREPDYILIDGIEVLDTKIPQKSIIKGDFLSHGISAAAIIAKVYRDNLMKELDKETGYLYGWTNNAGYPTKAHLEACEKYGLTNHHRKSWKHYQIYEKK